MEDKIICPLCGKEMEEYSSIEDDYPYTFNFKCKNDKIKAVVYKFKNEASIEIFTDKEFNLINCNTLFRTYGIRRYYIIRVDYYGRNIKDYSIKYYKLKTDNIYDIINKKHMKSNVKNIWFVESCIESFLDPEEILNDRRIDVLDCKDNIEMFLNDSPTVGQRS